MAVTKANAKPYWGNGHYYAFTQEDATWSEAYSSSQTTLSQHGTTGYLATVTASGENDFIRNYSYGTYTYTNSGSSPNYGGTRIPDNGGFLAGTDDNGQGTSEGTWIWKGGPENGTVFRSSSVNSGYTNWESGQPNNSGNQDFLRLQPSGYWDDLDPNENVSGYVTEWGKSGAEFTAGFASLTSSSQTSNGYENGTAPKMTITFDRLVPSDYVDIRSGTPLIDIPIVFGGTAVLGTDFSLGVSGGNSYYSNGRLYVRNTSAVTLSFNPINNSTWQAPRTITASLQADGSENIYGLTNTSSSQVRLFDDEPQLSLGQGAYQFIRTPYTSGATYNLPANNSGFNTNADVLVFDSNGINESESGLAAQGLYDSFAIRWETYIRIPETGNYIFRTTTDDGSKLTLRGNDSSGATLGSFTYWTINAATSHSTGSINLNKGDVVWLQFDYFADVGGASAKLAWDRPNGSGGTVSNEVIPASAMFLSNALARGVNRAESGSDTDALGFQLFANKSTSDPIALKLTSTSETSNSTAGTSLAQRQTGGTIVGNDYAIVDTSGSIQNSSLIGLNGTYGILDWTPDQPFGTLNNVQSFDLRVLTDPYAENSESLTLSLISNSGSGSDSSGNLRSGYGVSHGSQTITINDDGYLLALTAGQNPTEGGSSDSDLGWFTISSNKPAPAGNLVIRYQISGGTAQRGLDYEAPQATRTTAADFKAEDIVVLQEGSSSARIYIASIADAIQEGDETITLKLIDNVETDSSGFQYKLYNIESANSQATLTLKDSSAYLPAVVITPVDRTGLATVRAQLVNGAQQAAFELRLTSQPLAAVTVNLSSSSGSLSSQQLSFSSSNWTQPQRVTLMGLRSDLVTTVTASSSSTDSQYTGLSTSQRIVPSSWPSELELSLWEGGLLMPSQPLASVKASDGTEGSNSRLGFDLNLASPVVGSPVEVFYQLSESTGFNLEGSSADATHTPQASYRPLELRNDSNSGGDAYAELSGLSTVSGNGEISAEAWVRRDAMSSDAGVLEFTDGNGHNQISLGFHDTSGRPELEIRDPSGALLLNLIADSEVLLHEWNHLAYSVEASGEARLYVNGELAKQGQLAQASGLKVALYEGTNFETLRSSSSETTLNINDGFDIAQGGDGDTFTIRASGQIQAQTTGPNSFAVYADDGVRIWVNGTAVVDNWNATTGSWTSFAVPDLVAGEWYDIQIDHVERAGQALLQLCDQPNGTLITALRHVPLISASRSFNSIGRTVLGSGGSGYLEGAIRGVGIWNAARSQDQIQASMLAATASGSGLVSALPLNGSASNGVAGAPDAVLSSGTGNSATFADTPFYGLKIPVGASGMSLALVPIDDLTAEDSEGLTLTLIDGGRYSLAGSSDSGTAVLSDNDTAEVLFVTAGQPDSSGGEVSWSSTSQFRVNESDKANGSTTRLGIRLNSQPSATVTLRLDSGSYADTELNVTDPSGTTAEPVELSFTPENWREVQELQLQGVDDTQDDDDTSQLLSFTVSSSDAKYAPLRPTLSVLSVDDDATTANPALASSQSASAPLLSLSGPSRSTIDEAGSDSATFTISLLITHKPPRP